MSISTVLIAILACGGGRSSEEYIATADAFILDGQYKSAIIELKNALRIDAQSSRARWLLGSVYLELGDAASAEKELQRADEMGWTRSDVIPPLAEALLAQGKYSQLNELGSAQLSKEAQVRLLTSKARADLAQGKDQAAKRKLDRALQSVPDLTEALLARARILARQGDLAGALEALDGILARHPEQGQAWSLTGDVRMAQQNYTAALAAYDNAILFQRNAHGDRAKRALLYLQDQDHQAAQADIDILLRVAPNHEASNYIQGVIHFQAGKYEEAVSALSIAQSAAKEFPMVLYFLGAAQLLEGDLEQADVHANKFYRLVPESIRGRKLLSVIRLQQGNYQEVQDILQPVLDANPDDVEALNIMANAMLRNAKTGEGIALLSRVVALQPDSAVAQVRLGAGLLMEGKSDDAARHMETAVELDPEFQQADILLVLNHVQNKDYPAAIEAAEAYRRRNIASVTPHNLLGGVYLAAGQQGKAIESYEKALAFDASDSTANLSLGQIALANGDFPAARNYYDAILQRHENHLSALLHLARLDAAQKNEKMFVVHLEQAMDAHPEAIEPRVILARYHLSKGRPEQVAPMFSTLDKSQQQSPQVLQVQAMAQLSAREHGAAQYTLEQLMESSPATPAVHQMMAMAAAGTGDAQRARLELELALELDENFLPARIALAKFALSQQSMQQFEDHLSKLMVLAPENSDVLLLRAAAANLAGETSSAVSLARQSLELAPSSNTLLVLGSYLEAERGVAAAAKLYTQWLQEHPDDTLVRAVLANDLLLAGDVDAAKLQYQQILQTNPDNMVALNNLAWYMREENPGKALVYARRANALSPDAPEVLDTLAVVEYTNKHFSRARRSIDLALSADPDNLSLQYHSAMIAAAQGDEAEAILTLEHLQADTAAFPERTEALALLERLKK